ncbi:MULTISPECIES: hypothetical protein [Photorhabdus]|uniref:hypothetical protein n=1 Tax=Photorhabdus TaxID=29487 RepID=UPI001364DA93|nr:hypothetical protein [Photorhabdus aegyptia]MCC8459726.1 hypothetical protein [Photorhabdus aegyptia]
MTKEKKSDGWNNEKFDRVFAGSSSITPRGQDINSSNSYPLGIRAGDKKLELIFTIF